MMTLMSMMVKMIMKGKITDERKGEITDEGKGEITDERKDNWWKER